MRYRPAATSVVIAFASIALSSMAAAQASEGATEPLAPTTVELAARASTPADPLAPVDAPAAAPVMPSQAVIDLTNWILASADTQGLPFIVIDKVAAEVFIFDANGRFMDMTPALLGITSGDDSAPGVGDREMSGMPIEERTTPAGRFFAKFGPAPGNKEVLWVDYSTAVSLHPIVRGTRKERRLQRLKSPTPEDNRITYGCINVDPAFYKNLVHPLFGHKGGVVYILPETKALAEVFLAFQPQRPFGRQYP